MNIIEQNHEILNLPHDCLEILEKAGRTCYKSETRITQDSAGKFVDMLIRNNHHAMIEFGDIIVKLTTNRGVTHELVRHRMCSFAQESTRYVKYDKDIAFIRPVWSDDRLIGQWDPNHLDLPKDLPVGDEIWLKSMARAESEYKTLIDAKWKAQAAREILPNSMKTEIVVKANIREWRHIFALRCAKTSHPQMVGLMIPLLKDLKTKIPVVFNDLKF
ncbi:MAG: FAD-dependent thymidylate synthase [Desulfobacter sp.]|nr:MAG: FAD-dependent thymidylate synthase [Desulfobacter sp.]